MNTQKKKGSLVRKTPPDKKRSEVKKGLTKVASLVVVEV